jgi:hypothetical protein
MFLSADKSEAVVTKPTRVYGSQALRFPERSRSKYARRYPDPVPHSALVFNRSYRPPLDVTSALSISVA